MLSPLLSSGTAIASAIADGRCTSVQVVEQHIAHLQRTNRVTRAAVAERFEAARAEAREADALVAAGGPLPPLHGVPCTIKESFAVTGMPWTAGLYSRRHARAEHDAVAVARLRAAGAIVIAVTNTSELCMWMESDNRVYGRTNNPYDPRRMVGGSSGGEGAVVGAGSSPFGLGADVGGSIRLPAFFNGVFGHKPSGGLVPNTGQFPIAGTRARRFLTTGPLARRAEDLHPLLTALAGPDGRDPGCEALGVGDPSSVDLAKLRVFDVAGNGVNPVSRALRGAQEAVAAHMASRGARVEQRRLPKLRRAFDVWSGSLHHTSEESFNELMGFADAGGAWRDLLRWPFGRSEHTFPALMLGAFEPTGDWPRGKAAKWFEAGARLRDELEELLGDDGILLLPTFTRPAPRHGEALATPLDFVFTAALNIAWLPVTQVPLGLDRDGLPLGVQVAAARGADHRTIAVALELERAFGGWTPPALAREASS